MLIGHVVIDNKPDPNKARAFRFDVNHFLRVPEQIAVVVLVVIFELIIRPALLASEGNQAVTVVDLRQ